MPPRHVLRLIKDKTIHTDMLEMGSFLLVGGGTLTLRYSSSSSGSSSHPRTIISSCIVSTHKVLYYAHPISQHDQTAIVTDWARG